MVVAQSLSRVVQIVDVLNGRRDTSGGHVSIHRVASSIGQRRATTRRQEDTAMKLTTNESPLDRIIRIVAGLGLAGLAIAGIVTAPVAYAAWLVAAVLLVTGIVGFCPLYALLHVSTKRVTD